MRLTNEERTNYWDNNLHVVVELKIKNFIKSVYESVRINYSESIGCLIGPTIRILFSNQRTFNTFIGCDLPIGPWALIVDGANVGRRIRAHNSSHSSCCRSTQKKE
jgi:uncharacterized ubiquitin-like protein YukD